MQKAFHTGFFLLSILLFSFCSDNDIKMQKQLQMLDSLKLELEKGMAVYKTIDTSRLLAGIREYDKNVQRIMILVKDTLEKKDGEMLNVYKRLKKPLLYLLDKNDDVLMEMDVSCGQLRDLYDDIQNHAIEDARAFEYYTQEYSNAADLLKQVGRDTEMAKNELLRFDTLNVKIKALIERYEGKLNAAHKK